MKRTREWWARLTERERSELVMLERADKYSSRSAYIPEDCSECGYCSTPSLSSGLCPRCSNRFEYLIRKASGLYLCGRDGLYLEEI